MLSHQLHPQRMWQKSHFKITASKSDINASRVFKANRDLRVTIAQHATVVDIGRSTNDESVVNNQQLVVDVDLIGEPLVVHHTPVAKTEEFNVLARVDAGTLTAE